jgi:hypothetical protein
MSIFASQTQSDPIPLPMDPPHWVLVRKLTARETERAQEGHRESLLTGSTRSWAVAFRRMLEKGAQDPEVLQAIADPLTGYDRYALVRAGLVAWSYPQTLTPIAAKAAGDGAPAPAYDAIEDLDDDAVDFIAREVLRLTKPSLFHQSAADVEAEKKTPDAAASSARWERAGAV